MSMENVVFPRMNSVRCQNDGMYDHHAHMSQDSDGWYFGPTFAFRSCSRSHRPLSYISLLFHTGLPLLWLPPHRLAFSFAADARPHEVFPQHQPLVRIRRSCASASPSTASLPLPFGWLLLCGPHREGQSAAASPCAAASCPYERLAPHRPLVSIPSLTVLVSSDRAATARSALRAQHPFRL